MEQVKQEPLPAAAVEGVFKTTSDKVVALLSLLDKRETKGAKEAKRAFVVHSALCRTEWWDFAKAIRPTPDADQPRDPELLTYTMMGRRQAEEAVDAIKAIIEEPNLTGYGARALTALQAELEEFSK